MDFTYDKSKFIKDVNELIEQSIEMDKSGKLFEILTRLKDDGTPSYTYSDTAYFIEIYKDTNSIERVEKAAKLKSDKNPIYDTIQMFHISQGYKYHFPYDYVDLYAKLNKSNEPIFNHYRMGCIFDGFKSGLSEEEVMLYTKLNENEIPVYDQYQMDVIKRGLIHKLSVENVNLYARLDENMVPIYDSDEMNYIEYFMYKADNKQIQQLKDAIADELSFEQFKIFTKPDIPAEKMRIYRSLYQLDCSISTVQYVIDQDKLTYDELKQIKYIVSCAKKFRELLNDDYTDIFVPYNFMYGRLYNFDSLYENFAYRIHKAFMSPIADKDILSAVIECLKKNMDPEQIHFLVSSGYSDKEIEIISESLINGADFNELKKLHEEAKDVLENEEMSKILRVNRDDDEELQI